MESYWSIWQQLDTLGWPVRYYLCTLCVSPVSQSEYYCCCLCYPPFPSLPLTEWGSSYSWATSTFVGFYCCGEEAIAIERVRVALPDTDRWDPGLQMVRGSLGGRKTTSGSKSRDLPGWLSPHLARLRTSPLCLLPRRLVSRPVFLIDQWPWPAPDCHVWVHSGVTGGELCSSLSFGGQMKSQLDLTTGMRAHIFSTDLHLTAFSLR